MAGFYVFEIFGFACKHNNNEVINSCIGGRFCMMLRYLDLPVNTICYSKFNKLMIGVFVADFINDLNI